MPFVHAQIQTVEEIYRLVSTAVATRQPIEAMYQGRIRSFCPHRLGRNRAGLLRALCYQFGGESHSGLQPADSPANWRCVAPGLLCGGSRYRGRRSSRTRSTKRTLRELPEQVPGKDHSPCGNGIRIMPLGANAAIRAGGSPASGGGQRFQDGRRGQRGKNGSARRPGTHKPRCIA